MKEGILEHMNLVSAAYPLAFIPPASYYQEVQLAMEVPETGVGRGVGRGVGERRAVYSALALMILFSVKSNNCVWLHNKSLANDVYHMPFTADPDASSNVLRQIRYAVDQAKRNDPFFSSTPRKYDNSNVGEREAAIAVGATCTALYGSIVQDLFTTVTG